MNIETLAKAEMLSHLGEITETQATTIDTIRSELKVL